MFLKIVHVGRHEAGTAVYLGSCVAYKNHLIYVFLRNLHVGMYEVATEA
jgi:hypothetical protein